MGVRSGKGDKGYTDLSFHNRISKDSDEICAIGGLDELNSYLGLIKCKIRTKKYKEIIEKIQRAIYVISSELTIGQEKKKKMGLILRKEDVDWIDSVEYQLERTVKIEQCFYLPGGTELSAIIDVARSVARRAERAVVALSHKEEFENAHILPYLNCVSDILFIMARKYSGAKKRVPKKRKTRRGK